MARKFAAAVFSLGCLQASSVMALGLGEMTLESFLNEPLEASVDLLNIDGLHQDEIKIRLATREDFDKLGLERAYFLTGIKFNVVVDDNGRARIIMTSDDPVLEPYLDFVVEARWPSGRLLREYTVLVDPPVFSQATPVISASERVTEVEGIPAPTKKKQGPAASSGTRVDVKKSDLAPGAMPQRDYSSETSATPMPGSRYMINRDDTLWEIALAARPEGASVHQTMLDIQRLNPDAFIDGNINRVKAGYIVYLPDSGDISSADMSSALAEVRQQNEDWREGRASDPVASSGPSLRISAAPEESDQSGTEGEAPTAGQREVGASAAALEDLDKAELERTEAEQRLVAMEQQVETLQRIVNLKDDQIAALQSALADAGQSGEIAVDAADADAASASALAPAAPEGPEVLEPVLETAIGQSADDAGEPVDVAASETETEAEAKTAPEPVAAAPAVVKPAAAPAQPQPAGSGGFMGNTMYLLGALLLAIVGFIFFRRRGSGSEAGPETSATAAKDVFADVELKDQELELEPPSAQEPPAPITEPEETETDRDNRGYGERKHDAYASDVEASDALAEADIYIAYGRYPQALDLLNNAIANEPQNPVYRLKVLEIHAERGDKAAAMEQFGELQSINDPGSLARAQELLDGLDAAARATVAETEIPTETATPSDGPGLAPSPIELMSESDTPLEADFSGLEIEEPVQGDTAADELDLSADFAASESAPESEEEELLIAAESNGFSTKLDLARAYMDMGDDDGARQILEEVAAEGTAELKAEAQALLERIG